MVYFVFARSYTDSKRWVRQNDLLYCHFNFVLNPRELLSCAIGKGTVILLDGWDYCPINNHNAHWILEQTKVRQFNRLTGEQFLTLERRADERKNKICVPTNNSDI
jgi:hypothetical protein